MGNAPTRIENCVACVAKPIHISIDACFRFACFGAGDAYDKRNYIADDLGYMCCISELDKVGGSSYGNVEDDCNNFKAVKSHAHPYSKSSGIMCSV